MEDKTFDMERDDGVVVSIIIKDGNIYTLCMDIEKHTKQYFSHNHDWMNVDLLLKIFRAFDMVHFKLEDEKEFFDYLRNLDKEGKSEWIIGQGDNERNGLYAKY